MRLDPIFDSFYILGSLWGGMTGGAKACSSIPHGLVREITLTPGIEATAFVNVNVVPMDTERVITGQTVLVQGGRITALGPANMVSVPAGAVRINGRGKYLIPGLVDMHTHNYFGSGDYDKQGLRLFTILTNGVTAIRFLNGFSGDPRAFDGAKLLSPHIYVSGFSAVFGNGEVRGYPNWKIPLAKPDSVVAFVASAKTAGYDFVEVSVGSVPHREKNLILDSLLTAARRLGLPVMAHDHDESFGRTLAFGTVGGSVEHLTAFRDTLGFRMGKYSDTLEPREMDLRLGKISALAAAVQRAGVWITPTLDCMVRKYNPSPVNLLILRQIVKSLQDTDVRLLLGAEGQYVPSELAALVGAGLTPYQALLTGTRNPAQYFGLLDSTGTVAVGKRADLVLLSGNPLADIRHTREPVGVMLAGRWLDRAELDQRLLAFPKSPSSKSWLSVAIMEGGLYLTAEQRDHLKAYVEKFEALTDSLVLAKSSGRDGASTYQRMLQLLATELGAMRAILTPEQYDIFDSKARVWMREQARQGSHVVVPGVAPVP